MLDADYQTVDTRPARERDVVSWCPDTIAGLPPVKWNVPSSELINNFSQVLEQAPDEKPLQSFFEHHPVALLTGLVRPHRAWVIPTPKLPTPDGGGWIPDFIICEWSSVGPDWIIVELESPTKRAINKDGKVSATCNHAVQQINDYKTYLRNHAYFLRGEGKWPKLHGECTGAVIIGRRNDPQRAAGAERLDAFKRQRIDIISYDRLLDDCTFVQEMVSSWWNAVAQSNPT
jgi:hypothetical protein